MFTQKELLNIVKKLDFNNGSFKIFIKLSNKFGLKLCETENLRDNNYSRQELASLVNLGPGVYGKFDICINGRILYGYYTEVVEVFLDYSDFKNKYRESDLDQLKLDLQNSISFNCFDVRYINVGIKNGKLVLIDFDSNDDCWGSSAFNMMDLIDKL